MKNLGIILLEKYSIAKFDSLKITAGDRRKRKHCG